MTTTHTRATCIVTTWFPRSLINERRAGVTHPLFVVHKRFSYTRPRNRTGTSVCEPVEHSARRKRFGWAIRLHGCRCPRAAEDRCGMGVVGVARRWLRVESWIVRAGVRGCSSVLLMLCALCSTHCSTHLPSGLVCLSSLLSLLFTSSSTRVVLYMLCCVIVLLVVLCALHPVTARPRAGVRGANLVC